MKNGGIDNINMKTIKLLSDHIVEPIVYTGYPILKPPGKYLEN